MSDFNTLEITENGPVTTVWLNRPEVHNAINDEMIRELHHFFTVIAGDNSIRIVILRGKGPSFCAGADLKYMKKMGQYSYDQNYQDSLMLAQCFYSIFSSPKVVLSAVHGSALGGANGLIAASDLAVATSKTQFALGEVSLGLVPAVISPYLIRKAGHSKAREWMLLGSRFTAEEALQAGLIHKNCPEEALDATMDVLVKKLLQNSPGAMTATKQLLEKNETMHHPEEWMAYTAGVISNARVSEDGQEGMTAFFDKRTPSWVINL